MSFCLEVSSEFACFTRPELKVERVSYDVPTPSAVRGFFEAIFWKPAIIWRVERIEVLNPVRWFSIKRNEVCALVKKVSKPIYINEPHINEFRQQKTSLILRDVKYRFHACFEYVPPEKRKNYKPESTPEDESPEKYTAIFTRRASKGQVFHRPYLGCREFAADFRFIPNPDKDKAVISPELKGTTELGYMFYDNLFSDDEQPKPFFFKARMVDGVIDIPRFDDKDKVLG